MTIPSIVPVLSRISQIEARIGAHSRAPIVIRSGGNTMPTFESTFAAVGGTAAPTTVAGDAGQHTSPVDHAVHDHADGFTVVPNATFGPAAATFDRPAATLIAPAATFDNTKGVDAVPSGVPYESEFAAASARHGVPGALLAAVGWVESRYQPDAVSPAGAIGVMQLMPFVADELGVDARDPAAAIDGAARLLDSHHDRFGSWDLALAAYHAGAGAVSRAGNVAPSPRTAEYVRRVNERMSQT